MMAPGCGEEADDDDDDAAEARSPIGVCAPSPPPEVEQDEEALTAGR